MTNYEKIMSEMTVEQLANYMAIYYDGCKGCPLEASIIQCIYHSSCEDSFKKWLESEV